MLEFRFLSIFCACNSVLTTPLRKSPFADLLKDVLI